MRDVKTLGVGLFTAVALSASTAFGGGCPCPAGGIDEGEACGADTNGGCNATPNAFGSIACGDTICGTAFADGGSRDTDWFLIEITETTEMTATLTSAFSGVVFIVGGIDTCAPAVLGTTGDSADCTPGIPANATVDPGNYVVFVAPAEFEGAPCGGGNNEYSVTLTCEAVDPPPASCGPGAGDCFEGNGTPGCDNVVCCTTVCDLDPFCCETEWDETCAGFALELCGQPGCELPCPAGALEEGEDCGTDTNGGCNSTPAVFGAIECGDTICGTAFADGGTRDTDWYLITLDECTELTATLTSQFNGVCFIVGGIDTCAPVVLGQTGASADCVSTADAVAEVGPGNFVVFVAPAEFEGAPCGGGNNDYVLSLSCAPCVAPCDLVCPAGASDEGEDCGADTNGGCNSTPTVFGAIADGETICGDAFADGGTRDTDWYIFEVTENDTQVTADLVAEFNAVVFLVGGIDTCAPVVLGATGASDNCEAIAPASGILDAGMYVVFVAPAEFEGTPCTSDQKDYQVTLTLGDPVPPCDIVCNGTDEGEACGADTNGGCNSTPVAFGSIAFGETVCGTSFADGGSRDTDWFQFSVTETTDVTVDLNSEFPGVVFLVGGIDTCAPVVLGEIGAAGGCEPIAQASATLDPGTYVVFVSAGNPDGSGIFEGVVCGEDPNEYEVTLNAGGGCPCVWDLDGDCDVDAADLASLLAQWNNPFGPADLAALLAEWNCSG